MIKRLTEARRYTDAFDYRGAGFDVVFAGAHALEAA
jgi:hypothetical protein